MRTAIHDKEVLVVASPRAFAACVWPSGQQRVPLDSRVVASDDYVERTKQMGASDRR